VITRLEAGGSISRRHNPLFDADDDRRTVYTRVEHQFSRALRVRGLASWQDVSFRDEPDRFTTVSAEAIFDTRLDPFLARDAVYIRGTQSRLVFDQRDSVNRTDVEAHGYLGLVGQAILIVSAKSDRSDRSLPLYLKPLIGGPSTVRGFKTGTAAGDSLVGGSLEVRVPLTSPLSFGKVGVSGFVDAGAVYDNDQRLSDQNLMRGAGGSVWFTAAILRINVAVAHGIGSSTRVQLIGNLTF
jgi:outer membrane protein assembly factor BamA